MMILNETQLSVTYCLHEKVTISHTSKELLQHAAKKLVHGERQNDGKLHLFICRSISTLHFVGYVHVFHVCYTMGEVFLN